MLSLRSVPLRVTGYHGNGAMNAAKYINKKLLACFSLAAIAVGIFALQVFPDDSERVDAATGVIDALNVGTCLATDASIFEEEGCHLSNRSDGWEIRDEVERVSTLYATYAHDPKTAWDEPRAILQDTDLIKISIYDPDRDRRSGVLVRGQGHDEIVGGLAEIEDLLRDRDLLGTDENLAFESGTRLIVRDNASIATVPTSGSRTLNFEGGTSYKPMDGDGNIRFFGCVTDQTVCVLGGSGDDKLVDVSSYLPVDEDRVSGSINPSVAPWLAVNAGIPSGKQVHIYAIYYETSDRETMVGGQAHYYCSNGDDPDYERNGGWRCGSSPARERDGVGDVEFTRSEIDGNDELLLRARSDGDHDSVNLYLTETGLFTGRYEGYLRLTDPNGDGRFSGGSSTATDWGLMVRDGSGSSERDAAVVGVGNGPVTIEYRDTNGRRRSLRIEVDNEPPRIQIDSPRHLSSSDDHSPDFIGSFEDNDSGLAQDSFRLVVDNDPDASRNSDFALDGIVPRFAVRGSGPGGSVQRQADYVGYSTSGDDPFGVIDPGRLFDLGDDSCSRNQDRCFIEADSYDDGDSRGRFDDSVRLRLQGDDLEFGVDFQAFVVDLAGNVGFSDSDPENPYFIDDLGQEDSRVRVMPNVLGYRSAHIIGLDEKDPEISTTRSATGYYGRDRDDEPVVDRRGVMLVFDGPIAPASVGLETFYVEFDDGSNAEVVDVDVDEEYVFLRLADDLESDETPWVGINSGESVRDMAGNITSGRELKRFEANDGISPQLTVTLSNGSGTGEGAEGPDQLTNGIINIHVSSDEPIQGSPTVIVVCESLSWEETVQGRKVEYDLDDFIANRHGAFNVKPGESSGTDYTCGHDINDDDEDDPFDPTEYSTNARPGENWETEWRNIRSGSASLNDGRLRVVAFARDRSRHVRQGQFVQSWGAASTTFALDTEFESPLEPQGGEVQPRDKSETSEIRPFIYIEFNEPTSVTLDSVTLDGVEIADEFTSRDLNRFVYWPFSMSRGEHEVEVEATDAAGNEVEFDFEFTSVARGDFVLDLVTGWNAISFPSDPIDANIDTVFTDPEIQAVIGWDTEGWRVAVRRDGIWESSQSFGVLHDIRARYGYWVKSNGFVRQPVALRGTVRRSDGAVPTLTDIPTEFGWNFVGVIDADGDQTEDHFGVNLLDSQDVPVTARDYLGDGFIRAYTWDATFNRFITLRPSDAMTIGQGVWVYYSDGRGIAP